MKTLMLNSNINNEEYFRSHGVDITYEFGTLPGIFPLILVASKLNESGVMTDFYTPDVIDAVREIVKPGEYDEVVFCYNPNQYDSRQNSTGGCTFGIDVYLGTQLSTVRLDGYESLYDKHEGMHRKTHKLQRLGYPVNDDMDMTIVNGVPTPYYHNEQVDFPDGNYERTWKDIQPYISHLNDKCPILSYSNKKNPWVYDLQLQLSIFNYDCGVPDGFFGNKTLGAVRKLQRDNNIVVDGIVGPITLGTLKKKSMLNNRAILQRISDNGKETIGTMTLWKNGQSMTVHTLELPWRNNAHNISCIPAGTYTCKMAPFHHTRHYELQNVLNRTGIFQHNGNYYFNSEGCIIIGQSLADINKDGQIDVTNSVATLDAMERFMGYEDYVLTILDVVK